MEAKQQDAASAAPVAKTGGERRRAARVAGRYKGRIEISGYGFSVMTWDVSLTGARCAVRGKFPEGTVCTLFVQNAKGEEMGLPARVVRGTGNDVRLSFSAVSPEASVFLRALTGLT
uniref:Type IV pilus assembly PilZ n=1 Tax=Nitratidesulfovibrio vulgaris (strain DSM 19637 / Miyazaki F) TaxID=883 RepID=B8DP24_NITV9